MIEIKSPTKEYLMLLGLLLVTVVGWLLFNSFIRSINDASSIKRLEECHQPKFISIQTLRYGTPLYHYQCSDGKFINSTVRLEDSNTP